DPASILTRKCSRRIVSGCRTPVLSGPGKLPRCLRSLAPYVRDIGRRPICAAYGPSVHVPDTWSGPTDSFTPKENVVLNIETRLEEMGLVLPAPGNYRPSVEGPPVPVLVRGNTAYVSGTSARNPDGTSY